MFSLFFQFSHLCNIIIELYGLFTTNYSYRFDVINIFIWVIEKNSLFNLRAFKMLNVLNFHTGRRY